MLCSLTVGLSPVKGCLPGPSPASHRQMSTRAGWSLLGLQQGVRPSCPESQGAPWTCCQGSILVSWGSGKA